MWSDQEVFSLQAHVKNYKKMFDQRQKDLKARTPNATSAASKSWVAVCKHLLK